MTINLDQYTNTLSVTDTATNVDLSIIPKGTGLVKSSASYGVTAQTTSAGGHFGSGLGFDQTATIASSYGRIQPYSLSDGLMYLDSAFSSGGFVFRTSTSLLTQFRVSHTASAVNYVQVTGNATGGGPSLSTQGSDTNINFFIRPKNSGALIVNTGGGFQLTVIDTASAVNWAEIKGGATGSGPQLAAVGSDTNIDLSLTPKGTGNVRFGTYTGTILTPTGYVEIKDSGGTVRRLLVG